jgi:hypothetical protein
LLSLNPPETPPAQAVVSDGGQQFPLNLSAGAGVKKIVRRISEMSLLPENC